MGAIRVCKSFRTSGVCFFLRERRLSGTHVRKKCSLGSFYARVLVRSIRVILKILGVFSFLVLEGGGVIKM